LPPLSFLLGTEADWASAPMLAGADPYDIDTLGRRLHTAWLGFIRKLQACLRWRNAHARHPGVLAAQRRERARIRSERQQRWGRPKPKAA
jgi:hypothetical protein